MKSKSEFPVIGVTGITGSGTSTVCAILADRGGYVAHADGIAHAAMAKNEPAYTEIVSAFGRKILGESGEINRRVLATRVFGNKADLTRLEQIIHPRVIERTRDLFEKAAKTGAHTFAVIDAPLLIESGMSKMCDSIWLITAHDETRLARIMARDNIDEPAATRRLKARNPESTLREHANIIIENNAGTVGLRSKIETALKAMQLNIHGWAGCKVLEI